MKGCQRWDSNPHGFRHYHLKVACIPISPLRRARTDSSHRVHREIFDPTRRCCFNSVPSVISVTVIKYNYFGTSGILGAAGTSLGGAGGSVFAGWSLAPPLASL